MLMIKLYLPVLAFFFLIGTPSSDSYVYICTGPKSECYHKTDKCHGLNKCSGEIKKVTKDEAVKMKRRECKICY